jgi:NYN domain/OST-HTH/LOTUS domain
MADDVLRLAVLIDADNASVNAIPPILSEVASFGTASIKRIYGDFTTSNLGGWRAVLAEHAIQPIQQFRNTTGKNASDSALIIDAMDLLHTRTLGGFCLVSSDSDFTRLATRIREDGIPVYGFGEQKTPKSFVQACDRFIYTEIFKAKPIGNLKGSAVPNIEPLRNLKDDDAFKIALDESIEMAMIEGGRAHLGRIGAHLSKLLPDFDPRNYGYQKLSDLVESIPNLKVVREKIPNSTGRSIYVTRP